MSASALINLPLVCFRVLVVFFLAAFRHLHPRSVIVSAGLKHLRWRRCGFKVQFEQVAFSPLFLSLWLVGSVSRTLKLGTKNWVPCASGAHAHQLLETDHFSW